MLATCVSRWTGEPAATAATGDPPSPPTGALLLLPAGVFVSGLGGVLEVAVEETDGFPFEVCGTSSWPLEPFGVCPDTGGPCEPGPWELGP